MTEAMSLAAAVLKKTSTTFDGKVSFMTLTAHLKARSHRRDRTELDWQFVILNIFRTSSVQ